MPPDHQTATSRGRLPPNASQVDLAGSYVGKPNRNKLESVRIGRVFDSMKLAPGTTFDPEKTDRALPNYSSCS